MDPKLVERVGDVLREAAETHHRVYRIVDGADDDWASWYSNWLVNLSDLPNLLETTPVRSELTYELVGLGRRYGAEAPGEPWESFYAERLIARFQPGDGQSP